MMFPFTILLLLGASASAAPSPAPQGMANPLAARAATPTVTITNGTIIGSTSGTIDSFSGIPFAEPPVGSLRLKPPQSISTTYGTIEATGTPTACPQFFVELDTGNLAADVIADLAINPAVQAATVTGEDCLTLNVQKPSTANSTSQLPVLLWIFGGGFEFGSTQLYDGTQIIEESIDLGQDIVYVAINYRVGGFGFLAGEELQQDGSTNLGLRDQRLALQWVQENIEAFGGDPDKVTIWGESAGAISVFDHTIINGGDHTYNGKPLFRAGIMDSGSILPADNVTCDKAQTIFNTVVEKTDCSNATDTLTCLRDADYETFLAAVNSVPALFGYRSIDLSYLPRPDPSDNFFPVSPEIPALAGEVANVSIIIGDQEDEGTLFTLFQTNLTTSDELVDYIASVFVDAPRSVVEEFVALYPDDIISGSPFRTLLLNNIYPEYKRFAAITGDILFTLTRRQYLNAVADIVPAWSYLASYFYGTLVLGTTHASDILVLFFDLLPVPATSIAKYYVSFVNSLDPNAISQTTEWPQWTNGSAELVNFLATGNEIITDDFRESAYEFLTEHISDFRH